MFGESELLRLYIFTEILAKSLLSVSGSSNLETNAFYALKSDLCTDSAVTSIRPPSGVNLTALERRLYTICLSLRLSATMEKGMPLMLVDNFMPCFMDFSLIINKRYRCISKTIADVTMMIAISLRRIVMSRKIFIDGPSQCFIGLRFLPT